MQSTHPHSKPVFKTTPGPHRAPVSSLLAKPTVVSRHHRDEFGQPRPLSAEEVVLHAVARSLLIGVAVGYLVAISVALFHGASTPRPSQPEIIMPEEL